MALANTVDADRARAQLQDWLARRLPTATEVEVAEVEVPSASGLSAETVLFRARWTDGGQAVDRRLVARVQPRDAGLFMAYDLGMEFRVMAALGATPVPVPEAVFEEPDPSVLGAPFIVMERVAGRVAPDDPPFPAGGWVVDLSAEDQARLADNAMRALVTLHDQDIQALGLADVGHGDRERAGLDRLIDYWKRFAAWAIDEPHPLIDAAIEHVETNRPADPGPDVLVWGDARIGNMLIGDDLSVGAIIDWEMVATGPREVDLGWWLFLLTHHSAGIGVPLPEGFPSREAEIARYEELSGHAVTNLAYFEILAGLRMCVLVARAAALMKGAGLIPQDSKMAHVNPATALLAGLLGVPAPTGDSDYYIGNR